MDLLKFEQIRLLLRNHIQRCSDQPFKCEVCGTSFDLLGSLTAHRRTHTVVKPRYPDDMPFAKRVLSTVRQQPYARGENNVYKCDVCDARFSSNSSLTRHRRTHTGDKPYKCDVCGLRFSQNSDLTRHHQTHTGDKPYLCHVCGKTFSRKCNVGMHLRAHATGGYAAVHEKQ